MTGAGTEEQSIQWGAEMEVALFYAMRRHKPVGINKNFHMMCIHEKLLSSTNIKISSKQIWEHLDTMYDMNALHESEVVPFPNQQSNFELPNEIFGDLKKERRSSDRGTTALDEEKRDSRGKFSANPASSEKDSSKRKRTRQSAGTPSESSTKRRR